MNARIRLLGTGHSMGSNVVSNHDLAVSLGLPPDWLVRRTGIIEHRGREHRWLRG